MKKWLRKWLLTPEEQASLRGDAVERNLLLPEVLNPDAEKSIYYGYHNNPYVRGVVDTLADDLAGVGFKVFEVRKEGDRYKREEMTPVPLLVGRRQLNLASMLMLTANKHQVAKQVYKEFWVTRLVTGVGVLEFEFKSNREDPNKSRSEAIVNPRDLLSFHSVPTSRLEAAYDDDGFPVEYQIYGTDSKATKHTVDKADGFSKVLVLTAYNPTDPKRVRSALDSCEDQIRALNEGNRARMHAARGGLSASVLLTPEQQSGDNPKPVTEEQMTDIQYQIEQKATGAINSKRPVVGNFPVKVQDLTAKSQEMANKELEVLLALQVPMALGAPPQVFGFNTDANAYANYRESHSKYYQGLVNKHVDVLADKLSVYLSTATGRNIMVEVDRFSIPLLAQIEREDLVNAQKAAGRFSTLNEMRERFQLCPVDEIEDPEEREMVMRTWDNVPEAGDDGDGDKDKKKSGDKGKDK